MSVQIDELMKGYVPGGGLAHHFAHKGGQRGLMVSFCDIRRYQLLITLILSDGSLPCVQSENCPSIEPI